MDIVTSIRSILQSVDPDRDIVIDYAAEYAEECAALNERMRQVVTFLRAGQQGEALKIASAEPDVLVRYGELDFPELQEWVAFLFNVGLEPPPPLLEDEASEIDTAFTERQSIEPLLVKHRILALRRGPVKQRIFVLRQMLDFSSENPLWRQDLEEYEKYRLKEIVREAKSAQEKKNLEQLREIYNEINQPWTCVAVAPQLQQSIGQAIQSGTIEQVRKQLEKTNHQLNQALSEMDYDRAKGMVAQWNDLAAKAQVAQGDPLYESVREVFDWLADEEKLAAEEAQFQSAIAQLELLLDQNSSYEEVERQYYILERFERDIPASLRRRVADCRTIHDSARKRKFIGTVSLVAAVIILLAGAAYYFISSINYASKKENAIAELTQLAQEENWDTSVLIYENLEEGLRNEPEIKNMGESAKTFLADAKAKTAAFETQLKLLKESPFDPPPYDLIDEVEAIATRDADKNEVRNFKLRVDSYQRDLLSKRDEKADQQVTKFLDRLDVLEKEDPTDERIDKLSSLEQEITDFVTENSGRYYRFSKISSGILDRANALKTRIKNEIESTSTRMKADAGKRQLKKMVAADESPEDYRIRLQLFASKNPQSSEASILLTAADAVGLAKSWNQWSQFSKLAAWSQPSRISKEQAIKLLTTYTALKRDYPDAEPNQLFEPAIAILKKRSERKAFDASAFDKLREFLDEYKFREIWVLERKPNDTVEKYYVPTKPELKNGVAVSQPYFVVSPRNAGDIPATKTVTLTDVSATYPAPHSETANALIKILLSNPTNLKEAKTKIDQMLVTMKSKAAGVDPVVWAIMFEKVLETAVLVDPESKSSYENGLENLEIIGLDAVEWVNLKNKVLPQKYALVKRAFEKFYAAWKPKGVSKANNESEKPILQPIPSYVWAGVAFRDEGTGNYEIAWRKKLDAMTDLFILVQENKTVLPQKIGSWDPVSGSKNIDEDKLKNSRFLFIENSKPQD